MTAADAVRELDDQLRVVPLYPFVPEVLYHYTSAEGLLGIIQSGVLRAGHFSYFNDASELTYGQELVNEVLAEEIGAAPTSLLSSLSLRLQSQVLNLSDEFDFYLSCFCSQPDLLSQWRGYGSGHGRFCIAFDSASLPDEHKHLLGGVEYDESKQRERIENALQAAVAVILEHSQDEVVQKVEALVLEKLSRELCFFKHPGFAEEHEWRAVQQLRELDEVNFRAHNGLIKPFTELFKAAVAPDGVRRLPIVQVIVGSSPMAQQAVKSVTLLLARNAYTAVTVSESAVPFRDY